METDRGVAAAAGGFNEVNDGDSFSSSDDDSIEITLFERLQRTLTNREYATLIHNLRNHGGDPMDLTIPNRDLFVRVLQTVDEFCEALLSIDCLDSITLGSVDDKNGDTFEWPKLELNNETGPAFDKLCRAIRTACDFDPHSLGEICLGGYALSGDCMTRILQALCDGNTEIDLVALLLPWNTISGDEYQSFVEALSRIQSKSKYITLDMCGDIPSVTSSEMYLASEPKNHLEVGSIISRLMQVNEIGVSLMRVNLNPEECSGLADIVRSSSCSLERLSLLDCTLLDGMYIVEALQHNASITWLSLNVAHDKSFQEALLRSLSFNESIKNIVIADNVSPNNAVDILRHVAAHNNTITYFRDTSRRSAFLNLSDKENQSLLETVRQNYTLEQILYGTGRVTSLFPYVTMLNKAGRRYLVDDGASRSKCIAVLAKVKNNADCRFFHLRENPILCTTYTESCSVQETACSRSESESDELSSTAT